MQGWSWGPVVLWLSRQRKMRPHLDLWVDRVRITVNMSFQLHFNPSAHHSYLTVLILSVEAYFWNHHQFKRWYQRWFELLLSLVEILKCSAVLINSKLSLFWTETKIEPLVYHFGIYCRGSHLWHSLGKKAMLSWRAPGSEMRSLLRNQHFHKDS